MKENHSARFLRQRKMLVMLPLLVLPFLTMAFWALGGGKGAHTDVTASTTGLNLQLPDANLKDDKSEDKLSFYKDADADSLKREAALRNDPAYHDSASGNQNILTPVRDSGVNIEAPFAALNTSPYSQNTGTNEQRIYQKINELNKQINQPENNRSSNAGPVQQNENSGQFSRDVDRLQDMMQTMNDRSDDDTEMQQLNGTLQTILDIQHPERVKERLKEKSVKNKDQVFIITKDVTRNNIGIVGADKTKPAGKNTFYSLDNQPAPEDQNTVEAVIHQTQTLVDGAVVKLRLLDNIYINGSLIPKDNFVFGTAQLNNERLEITITSVRNNNALFPVKLEVYDMDGLPGIYIPGAISRDVAKQSADNGLQLMELTALDPSLKAQAAATGINAAKSLLSKKVKQVKVVVKAGYRVLLRDKNIQQ